jgi:hypothetical protein
MSTPRLSTLALALGLAAASLLPAAPALAHEHRDAGPYELTVGFIAEPAFQNEPNGVDFRVVNKQTNQPVEGLEKTLKVSVAHGGGPAKEFPLRARFRMPGNYTADLIPTRTGSYVFTFSGDINGQPVNERFESGPGRFNDVQTANYFPVADPTTAELQQSLSEARARAATANTMAMAGLATGILGLLLGAYALMSRRSAVAPARTMATEGARPD